MTRGNAVNLAHGAALALLVVSVAIIPGWVAGGFSPGEGWQPFSSVGSAASFSSLWLFFAVQALLEELLFRAVVMTLIGLGLFGLVRLALRILGREASPAVSAKAWLWGGFVANIMVATLFGAAHLTNPHAGTLEVLNIVLAGLALGQR